MFKLGDYNVYGNCMISVFEFVFNAKSFAFLVFFLFFLLVNFSERTTKSFLVNVLWYAIKKAYGQDLTYSLDTLKSFSKKFLLKLLFVTSVVHGTAYAW